MSAKTDMPLRVPEGARLLHIGPPKTGSTALQAAMHLKREEMRRYGVVHVASDLRGREAVLTALMDHNFGEYSDARLYARWRRLLGEIEEARSDRVCLSNESLARVGDEDVRRMVSALAGSRAHVVAVARRLDKLLPSQWQEWVRVGTTSLPYEQWLEVVLGDNPDDRHWRAFWLPHDLEKLVERWVAVSARDRMTLIVADETNPRTLSRAFEQLLGLPEDLLKPEESHRKNASASMARVELVRRLNQTLDDHDWPAEIKALLRSQVAKRIRSAAPWPGERPIPPMPAWAAARVSELNKQREELVTSVGVRVIGDPSNLGEPVPAADTADDQTDDAAGLVSTELAVQSIVTAIGGAVTLLEQRRDGNARPRSRPRRRRREAAAAPANRSLDQYAAGDLVRELRKRTVRRLRSRK